jgi:hypothetical protein
MPSYTQGSYLKDSTTRYGDSGDQYWPRHCLRRLQHPLTNTHPSDKTTKHTLDPDSDPGLRIRILWKTESLGKRIRIRIRSDSYSYPPLPTLPHAHIRQQHLFSAIRPRSLFVFFSNNERQRLICKKVQLARERGMVQIEKRTTLIVHSAVLQNVGRNYIFS